MGAMVSPLTGADGNVEFLVYARAATATEVGHTANYAATAVDEALALVDQARRGRA